MTERLAPASQQDRQAETLRHLLTGRQEDISKLWQDKQFLCRFPKMAAFLISSEGQQEFSQDQRETLFTLSLGQFLSSNNQKLTGYLFTKDGDVAVRNNNGILKIVSDGKSEPLSPEEKTDAFTKALIASILLIGMSLNDRERRSSLLIESYQNLSQARKNNFTDTLGRLLSENSATRAWIKDNKLDKENGFDWDSELAYTLFFGIYAKRTNYFPIPSEMKQDIVGNLSLQTRSVMLNFALEYAEKLIKSNYSVRLSDFIIQMDAMEMTKDMREKLAILKQKVSFTRSGLTKT